MAASQRAEHRCRPDCLCTDTPQRGIRPDPRPLAGGLQWPRSGRCGPGRSNQVRDDGDRNRRAYIDNADAVSRGPDPVFSLLYTNLQTVEDDEIMHCKAYIFWHPLYLY